jgi:hypothetical protein
MSVSKWRSVFRSMTRFWNTDGNCPSPLPSKSLINNVVTRGVTLPGPWRAICSTESGKAAAIRTNE